MIDRTISNRYKIEEELGSGGMATVFLAIDTFTGTKVAIKFLHPQHSKDFTYIERFNREAETAIKLDHPNIVKVLDFGSQQGEHFIVMEYIEGRTLMQVLQKNGKFTEDEGLLIAKSITDALDYAHSLGIIHRDIKPQNIMLTNNGEIKVADFGIAKATTMTTLTQTGMFMGSPLYTSPEQAKGEKVDIRSDIYSLGITLFELIEGHPPFQSDSPWHIINMHITQEPPLGNSQISPKLQR